MAATTEEILENIEGLSEPDDSTLAANHRHYIKRPIRKVLGLKPEVSTIQQRLVFFKGGMKPGILLTFPD